MKISVVIPCLNEADTLATCLKKAREGIEASGYEGEVVVADNGSQDESRRIAAAEGARVVEVSEKGYGHALMGGIREAKGEWVVMGDADDSYDFREIPKFVKFLESGADLVMGCRLPSGGGTVSAGAMPFSHRWLGNPMFSFLARWWFGAPIHDVNCGLRGFRRDLVQELDLRCTGMEFAVEMIIKCCLMGKKLAEVPIILHKDGRRSHPPHLKTMRDGWRSLRFYLLFCPRWVFLVPGVVMGVLGLLAYGVALPRLNLGGVVFDVHTLLFGSLGLMVAQQAILLGVIAKTFAVQEGFLPPDRKVSAFLKWLNLERGLLLALALLLAGGGLLGMAVGQWKAVDFGPLEYSRTMRLVIPGAMLVVLGMQTVLGSFVVGMLNMHRK